MSERDGRLARAKAMLAPHVFGHRLRRDGKVSAMEPMVPAQVAAEMLSRALPPAEAEEPSAEMVEAGAKMLDPHVWAIDLPLPTRADTIDFHTRRQDSAREAADVYLAMRAARPAGGREGGA